MNEEVEVIEEKEPTEIEEVTIDEESADFLVEVEQDLEIEIEIPEEESEE